MGSADLDKRDRRMLRWPMARITCDIQPMLLDRIADALSRGGALGQATLDYIEGSLFPPQPDRLAAFLIDDADSERDTLLDLIFYPDQPVQIDLEPLLETARLSSAEARELHAALMDRTIHAPIRMPGGEPLTRIRVPGFIKSRYLDRLNITWQLDARLAAAIERHVASVRQLWLKVRLRNTGRCFSPDQVTLLIRWVERMPDDDPDFDRCLDLVLAITPDSDAPFDPYTLLVAHKRSSWRNLQQVRRFESLLRRSNMETLMLQGVRAPHASAEALIDAMRLVDRICWHVFGQIDTIDLPTESPVRRVEDPNDTDALFRSLLS